MAEPVRQPGLQPVPAPAARRHCRARHGRAPSASYLADLNPEQREAVETLDGPVLVLAGAGTGKTRVLTTRIAHILNLGRARPSEILSVTFTNKAAREMKDRVGLMVGQVVEGMPWMGTFHSIGVKILRRHAELVGLKNNFTILDVDDQIRLIKQLFEAEDLDEKRWPARVFADDPRRLEEPRPDARPGAGRRGVELRQRQGQEALPRLSGAAEDAQRRRLRRPAARMHPPVPAEPGRAAAVSGALQVHSGRRISGHQRRAVFVAEAVVAAISSSVISGRAPKRANPGDPGPEGTAEPRRDAPGSTPLTAPGPGSGESGEEKHLLRRR